MTTTNKTTTVKRLKELFAYWRQQGKTVSLTVNNKEYTNIDSWKDGDLLLTGIESTNAVQKYHVQYIKKAANTSAGNPQSTAQASGVQQPPLVTASAPQSNSSYSGKPQTETIDTYKLTQLDETTFIAIKNNMPNYKVTAKT